MDTVHKESNPSQKGGGYWNILVIALVAIGVYYAINQLDKLQMTYPESPVVISQETATS